MNVIPRQLGTKGRKVSAGTAHQHTAQGTNQVVNVKPGIKAGELVYGKGIGKGSVPKAGSAMPNLSSLGKAGDKAK